MQDYSITPFIVSDNYVVAKIAAITRVYTKNIFHITVLQTLHGLNVYTFVCLQPGYTFAGLVRALRPLESESIKIYHYMLSRKAIVNDIIHLHGCNHAPLRFRPGLYNAEAMGVTQDYTLYQ